MVTKVTKPSQAPILECRNRSSRVELRGSSAAALGVISFVSVVSFVVPPECA